MPKYYLTTDHDRQVLQAQDPEGAAIGWLYRKLEQERVLSGAACLQVSVKMVVQRWGSTILVSEQGFSGLDSQPFSLVDIFMQCRHLFLALESAMDSRFTAR